MSKLWLMRGFLESAFFFFNFKDYSAWSCNELKEIRKVAGAPSSGKCRSIYL